MTKNSKPKSVTMVGGKNVAKESPPRQKSPKPDTAEPEEQKPAAPVPPQEPTK